MSKVKTARVDALTTSAGNQFHWLAIQDGEEILPQSFFCSVFSSLLQVVLFFFKMLFREILCTDSIVDVISDKSIPQLVITDHVRCTREGNVFTSVCLFTWGEWRQPDPGHPVRGWGRRKQGRWVPRFRWPYLSCRVATFELVQNSLTFPWQFPDISPFFPDNLSYFSKLETKIVH